VVWCGSYSSLSRNEGIRSLLCAIIGIEPDLIIHRSYLELAVDISGPPINITLDRRQRSQPMAFKQWHALMRIYFMPTINRIIVYAICS
jgi:hypothetical protein